MRVSVSLNNARGRRNSRARRVTVNRRRAFASLFVALACAALVGAGCGRDGGIGSGAGGIGSPVASSPPRPERIISLSPSATEILYGVGAFDRVVAVSDYCDYPPEVKNLPRIGGWQNTNLERVASFRPDLVVLAEAQAPFIKDKLDALGVRTLVVPSATLEDAFVAIEQIGGGVGREREGRELAAKARAEVEEVRTRVAGRPRRRVLCVVDRMPGTLRDLYAATEGSFISQLVEVAGGESIAPPAATGWGKIQKEAVVALDPEIIIDLMMQPSPNALSEDTQAVWKELPRVRAVREGRVHPLRDTSLIHPSQFVGPAARRFAELIHPEAFAQEAK
ncbi:MAG TPA: helical backbone metal receptor [Pyrinomonadaceae bacterium]|nr:helical backbone metal receptor [Pyrinomonadaceae bacterium]